MATANPPAAPHFPEEDPRPLLDESSLRHQLLGSKEPMAETSHQDTPAKVAPKAPVVERARPHDPVERAAAPAGAARPADQAPAVGRRSSTVGEFVMDSKLVRMVLRVSPDLQDDLISLSERLFDETRLEYSFAAILRGLIALGLASLAGKPSLAGEFAGARAMRGRKRGERWKRSDDEDE